MAEPRHDAAVAPLGRRPFDAALFVGFAWMLVTALFIDTVSLLDVPLTADDPNPLVRAAYAYGADTDPMFLERPLVFRLQMLFSAFVFLPFYVALLVALVRGLEGIRIPSLLYAATMIYAEFLYLGLEFLGPTPPPDSLRFLAYNAPFIALPPLLAYRMRRAPVFARSG